MNEEEEMLQLRKLYDELWHDAKTLIRDMKEGISMYKFSGLILLAFSFVYFQFVYGGSLKILAGSTDFMDYIITLAGIFGMVFFVLFGIRLLRWYYRLKGRYTKLLQMEKTIEA